jgi:hypothetical protein
MVCNLFQTAKLKWIGAGLGAGASRAGAGWVLSALDYLLGWIGVEVFCKKKRIGVEVTSSCWWAGAGAMQFCHHSNTRTVKNTSAPPPLL